MWSRPTHNDDRYWSFHNKSGGNSWRSHALWSDEGGRHIEFHFVEPQSIIAAEVVEDIAAIVTHESVKRPWEFSPQTRLFVVDAAKPSSRTEVSLPLVSDGSWPRRPRVQADLTDYLNYSIEQAHAATRAGAIGTSLHLNFLGNDRIFIDFYFTLGSVCFARRDEPFDELGNVAGLRAMNISLEEDMAGGLFASSEDNHAPVWV